MFSKRVEHNIRFNRLLNEYEFCLSADSSWVFGIFDYICMCAALLAECLVGYDD